MLVSLDIVKVTLDKIYYTNKNILYYNDTCVSFVENASDLRFIVLLFIPGCWRYHCKQYINSILLNTSRSHGDCIPGHPKVLYSI